MRVDPDTGLVRVVDYAMAHDTGVVINPLVVEGQHQGGFLMGLGMVLGEDYLYDDEGHLTNASFKNYLAPTATDMPELDQDLRDPRAVTDHSRRSEGCRGVGHRARPRRGGQRRLRRHRGALHRRSRSRPQKMLLALREKERQGAGHVPVTPTTCPTSPARGRTPTGRCPDLADDVDFDWDSFDDIDDLELTTGGDGSP